MATYAAPPRTMAELVAPFPGDVQAMALALRAVIRSELPDAVEAVSGGRSVGIALYSVGADARVVCGIQPARAHCKLYVHHVSAGEVEGVRLEGAGNTSRHVKVATVAQAESPPVREAIALAARAARR